MPYNILETVPTASPRENSFFKKDLLARELAGLQEHCDRLQESLKKYDVGITNTDFKNIIAGSTDADTNTDGSGSDDQVDGEKTCDYYKTKNLPYRFNHPSEWKFNPKEQHASYKTSSNEYGLLRVSVHEMPTAFYPANSKFSKTSTVLYRDFGLNK